jgi:hypothetical protein
MRASFGARVRCARPRSVPLIRPSGYAHGHGVAPLPPEGLRCAFTTATARSSRLHSSLAAKSDEARLLSGPQTRLRTVASRERGRRVMPLSRCLAVGARVQGRACGARPTVTQNVGSIRHFSLFTTVTIPQVPLQP